VGQSLEKEYPEVTTEYLFVDAAAMRIIQWPEGFDVMVTENMFGDILTDEASVISGSMGLMPSASIGLHTSVFEPIHGSYPQATGKNIANPLGTVLSAAMMFEYAFKLMDEAQEIKDIVNKSLEEGIVTIDIADSGKAYSTSEVGDWLAKQIN
jgi:3-isopropylmalate dehydrogenase